MSTHKELCILNVELQDWDVLKLLAFRVLLAGTLLTARAVSDYTDLIRASRVVLGREDRLATATPLNPSNVPVLSASDTDAGG